METKISKKERGVALLLCLLFGLIGVHRFYTGKHTSGIIMLLFTVVGFTIIISAIWVLIDFIKILVGEFKDADGNIISKWSN